MAKYRHSHIVSAGYLRAWTADDVVMTCWADGSQRKPLPVEVVGVRSGFYRERLPDGTTRDRLEPAMSKLEGKALDIIRDVESRWPLEGPDRAPVAEFMALQLMRSPAWREWYDETALDQAHRDVREAQPEHADEILKAAREALAEDHERHNTIVQTLAPLGTLMANMRWTLLRTGRARLATSDQPFVPVYIGNARVTPLSAVPSGGVRQTHEFRFALSPYCLLLLTWSDEAAPEEIRKASIEQVRNHNATVIEQADQHWFHHPAERPERMSPPWPPLAESVHGVAYQPRGNRWEAVGTLVNDMLAKDPPEAAIKLFEWDKPVTHRPSA